MIEQERRRPKRACPLPPYTQQGSVEQQWRHGGRLYDGHAGKAPPFTPPPQSKWQHFAIGLDVRGVLVVHDLEFEFAAIA
jgi:hypothetical protein